ncbi:ABC-type multidrug transport system, atpase component [Bacillus sp. OxB-1]|uniref:ATP-binding cassette domain-containing protein n=1 Tax=Bacillus sp. (strain OxB-1) TaxID=98228 RepID=UPI000581C1DB|nr:ABC transporter ATP-binding protein [Bacillus sp. OxB-1]BAQ11170.1 ABC-type multidrug transport system, atpase component [Bacillus sp. OxB-1]
METVIRTAQLTKGFKGTNVIKPLDFTLYKGEICALIGQNGAGKSTIFKMLSGQLIPTSGEIRLFGKMGQDMADARRRMGFLIETPAFFADFTAKQNLKYYALQRGIVEKNRIAEVLAIVGLANEKRKRFKEYSMGMKQRLGLALCLLSSPDCLVLDEPINGLDAEGIREIRNLLIRLNEEKQITIFISSHILTELHLLATRFVFLKDGAVVEDITKEALQEKSRKQLIVTVDDAAKAVRLLEQNYSAISYQVMPNQVIAIHGHMENSGEINRLFTMNGVTVMEFRAEARNLEEYFLELVGGAAI